MNFGAVIRLSRPFTLLAPALGMIAGAVACLGYGRPFAIEGWSLRAIGLGALAALLLNVASNTVNQIYDLEVDRINKPKRPLPAGELSVTEAWIVCVATYLGSIAAAWAVNDLLVLIIAFTIVLTYGYSGPPFRTKRHWFLANFTIAIPRGFLLPLAGWATIWGSAEFAAPAAAMPPDIWTFAAASALFIVGAASTKDFADLEGDKAGGCITLPLRFGIRPAVRIIAPFLVLPWLLIPVGAAVGWMSGHSLVLMIGGGALVLIGARAAWLLLRDPDALTDGSTHPAWVLMYILMLASQAVFALAYLLPHGPAA